MHGKQRCVPIPINLLLSLFNIFFLNKFLNMFWFWFLYENLTLPKAKVVESILTQVLAKFEIAQNRP